MMDLGKVKEALIMGLNAVESAGWTRSQEKEAQEIREALAELEKPVDDDAISFAERLWRDAYAMQRGDVNKKAAELIQQYAESYHAKKCAECEKEKADVIVTDRHDLVGGDGVKKYFFDGDNKTSVVTKRYQCGRCKRILYENIGHGWCPYCGIQLNWQPLPEAPGA